MHTSMKSKIKMPKTFFNTRRKKNKYDYEYNIEKQQHNENGNEQYNENSQSELIYNGDDPNDYMTQYYCFGFLKRRLRIRIKPLSKTIPKAMRKKNKCSNLETKVKDLETRSDTLNNEIKNIDTALLEKKPLYQALQNKKKTTRLNVRESSVLKKITRELTNLVQRKTEINKRITIIDNAIIQTTPAMIQAENINDMQLVTEAMKAAGKINSGIQTEKLIRDAEKAADQIADLQLSQEELDNTMMSMPSSLDVDVESELDEFLGISEREQQNIQTTRNTFKNDITMPDDVEMIMNLLPEPPTNNPRPPTNSVPIAILE